MKELFNIRGLNYRVNGTLHESTLEYYVFGEPQDTGCTYGIEVVKVEKDGLTERAIVPDITPSEGEAQALCTLLCSFAVTPSTANDIIEDWVVRKSVGSVG